MQHAAGGTTIARRLAEADQAPPLVLSPVEPPAHSFVLALLATLHPGRRLWVLGSSPRHRDRVAQELGGWGVPALHLPDPPHEGFEEELADPERDAERLAAFQVLADEPARVVLASADALAQAAPAVAQLSRRALRIVPGASHDLAEIRSALETAGFRNVPQVHSRQEFARRGGILDVFPLQAARPIRIEFFDEDIESIREFDPDSQASVRRLPHADLVLAAPDSSARLADWKNTGDRIVGLEEGIDHADVILTDNPIATGESFEAYGTPFAHLDAGDFILHESQQETVFQHVEDWLDTGWMVCVAAATEGERERFKELCATRLPKGAALLFVDAPLAEGFVVRPAKLAVIALMEVFGRHRSPAQTGRLQRLERQRTHAAATELNELGEDDLVVHADYGIGRFQGLAKNEAGDDELAIEYRDGATLSVPIDQSHLVSRYVGVGGKAPTLSQLGGGRWSKLKEKAEAAILDYAANLLRTQAAREADGGYAHPPDTKWMWEFENAFPFTETPDQLRAINEVKADMEAPRPMDRLICGDVGFGKTEVAIRAAFKAVTGGKQVAVLVPTTVLAEQHWRTFRERMSDFPVRIDLLNRFRTAAEVKGTIEGLAEGTVDIVIGTHRLLSGDIVFQDLGLAVVDEEQRFGVAHKEQFKERFRLVDVLTLSATPIPRTLYFSLMGARDMSTIDTAPPNRIPVHTSIVPYDERIIRDALRRELERDGQVFFLHNRVKSIEGVRNRLQKLVPEARLLVGHGQMPRDELEDVMHAFVEGRADILLATTIIESGIDIPNANTIMIDRADRFGLADLYQLRGRVGRANRRAYAILMLPRDLLTTGDARKRINAIQQYTALGSGFKIAMRDLEIRGAGNLLGTRQSGHIAAVGFDLYCQLLRQSVERLSGAPVRRRADTVFRADFIAFSEARMEAADDQKLPAYIPSAYIADSRQRVAAYRELASVASQEELRALEARWRDRFGRLPAPALHLILVTRLRLEAAHAGAELVEIKGDRLMVQRNGGYIMLEGRKFPRLSSPGTNTSLREAVEWLEALNRP
ncbi:MAG: transcription-repair coupling factor [Akkermansiaceae bacterium]|nr:transcription-repair coupling factor [Akkermansiaceae bacterium]